jgi:hypothetical protein
MSEIKLTREEKSAYIKICLDNYGLIMGIIKELPKEKFFIGSITEHFEQNGKVRIEKRDFKNCELSTAL